MREKGGNRDCERQKEKERDMHGKYMACNGVPDKLITHVPPNNKQGPMLW